MADGMQKNWRELCLAVTNETDSTKLSSLVQELIEALDSSHQIWHQTIRNADTAPTYREAA